MFNIVKPPTNKIRRFIFDLQASPIFETVILICIMINIVLMAIVYEGASDQYLANIGILNLVFTVIFICEAILKLSALGIRGYFHNPWNQFWTDMLYINLVFE